MPIDPSIPLQAKAIPYDPNQGLQNLTSLAQLANIPYERQRQQKMDQVTLTAADTQQKAAQLEMHAKKLTLQAQLLGSAVDQSSYDQAKAQAQQAGLDVSNAPPQFDPSYVKQMMMSTLSAKDRIDLAQQNLANQFKAAEFGETQRHNQAAEKNSAEGLDIKSQLADMKILQAQNPASKPMPATAMQAQNSALTTIGTLEGTNSDLQRYMGEIDKGNLKLGPLENKLNEAKNWAGGSDEESRTYASFRRDIQKTVNDSLMLAKGVQTEGDAERAAKAVLAAGNDTKLLRQTLQELQNVNKRSADLQKLNLDNLRANYGHEGYDYTKIPNQATVLPPVTGLPQAQQIKAAYQAGKLTKEQANAQLNALGKQ